MNEGVRKQPYGTTIFCDDIRVEVGNKLTLVGVYSSNMHIVGEFPVSIPKLCFLIDYREPVGLGSEDGTVRITSTEGDVFFEAPFPLSQVREQILSKSSPDDDKDIEKSINARIPVILSPFVIPKPTKIKVRMRFESRVVKLGTLDIISAQSEPIAEF